MFLLVPSKDYTFPAYGGPRMRAFENGTLGPRGLRGLQAQDGRGGLEPGAWVRPGEEGRSVRVPGWSKSGKQYLGPQGLWSVAKRVRHF